MAIQIGLKNRILVDQESKFWPSFVQIGHLPVANVEQTGVNTQNSLGLGERYHHLLPQMYRKIIVDYSNA